MISKDNYLKSLLYRTSSDSGFAINTGESINRIFKIVKSNDRNSYNQVARFCFMGGNI